MKSTDTVDNLVGERVKGPTTGKNDNGNNGCMESAPAADRSGLTGGSELDVTGGPNSTSLK